MYLLHQIKESSKIREAGQARVTDISREGEKEKVKNCPPPLKRQGRAPVHQRCLLPGTYKQ